MQRASIIAAVLVLGCGRSSSTPSAGSAGGAGPASAAPEAARKGRVVEGKLVSEALDARKAYRVYLPAGYDDAPARRYPVVYMLHGLGGHERNWLERGKLAEAADELGLQAIVVMPDGDASFYVDSVTPPPATCDGNPFNPREPAADYCVAHRDYERYLTRDVITHIDSIFRTIPERRARGVGGVSMGGFGALQLAMRHHDLYAAVASQSGLDSLFYRGPHPYRAGAAEIFEDVARWGVDFEPMGGYIRGLFGPDLANWKAHDPVTLAEQLAPGDLAVYLDAGTEDGLSLQDGAQYLHERLTARGIAHTWYLGPGAHDFDFFSTRIDDSLGFFAAALAPPTGGS